MDIPHETPGFSKNIYRPKKGAGHILVCLFSPLFWLNPAPPPFAPGFSSPRGGGLGHAEPGAPGTAAAAAAAAEAQLRQLRAEPPGPGPEPRAKREATQALLSELVDFLCWGFEAWGFWSSFDSFRFGLRFGFH